MQSILNLLKPRPKVILPIDVLAETIGVRANPNDIVKGCYLLGDYIAKAPGKTFEERWEFRRAFIAVNKLAFNMAFQEGHVQTSQKDFNAVCSSKAMIARASRAFFFAVRMDETYAGLRQDDVDRKLRLFAIKLDYLASKAVQPAKASDRPYVAATTAPAAAPGFDPVPA